MRKENLENGPTDDIPVPIPTPDKAEDKPKSISEMTDTDLKALGYEMVVQIEQVMAQRESLMTNLNSINEELNSRIKK